MKKLLSVLTPVAIFACLFTALPPVPATAESQDQGWQDFPEWIVSQEDYLKSRKSEVKGRDVTEERDVTSDEGDFTTPDATGSDIDFSGESLTEPGNIKTDPGQANPALAQPASSRVMAGVVTAAGVNCRKGPSLYEPVVFQFREGAYVKLDDFRDGWYQVVIDGPVAGWIAGKFVKAGQVDPLSPRTGDARFDAALSGIAASGSETVLVGTITGNNVNVRMGPTLDDPFVSRAFKGEKVLVEDERDEWLKIRWITSRKGWIHESLVKEISQVEGTVLPAGADIRLGPGPGHDLVRRVLRGMKLPVIDQKEGWYKVAIPTGQVGYIAGSDFEPPASMRNSASDSSPPRGKE